MKLGLALSISRGVDSRSGIIHDYFDKLKEFFKTRNYGDGIKDICIGVICVSPEYDSFFKVQRPKFTKSRTVVMHGLTVTFDHTFECDIKLDHESFKKADDQEVRRMLARELAGNVPNAVRSKKIKDFDIDRFQQDFEEALQMYIQPERIER